MVAELVRHVAGPLADVDALMSSGVDPHLYKPTTSDINAIMRADAVFYSGLKLEGPMQPAFERAAGRGRVVVAVTKDLPQDKIRHSEALEGHPDPHVWMDVALWATCLDPVVETLSKIDPSHAAVYEKNAAAYRKELDSLDGYIRTSLGTIPESQRYLVTAHDAFAYFSRAYGLTVRSVQGITTESEPGVEDVNLLVDFLVEHHIPALFVESSVSPRNLMAVLEGTAKRGAKIEVGGQLFSDAMGTEGTYEGTYVGMLDHNATVITRALHGEAPVGGFQGQLQTTEVSP
jgi:manganese/zinc/iron transport system substrate-binding protein